MARTIAKDYDQKRLSILSVAAEVFAREGIARASMNEVARSGGISKANIYHYYESKDALLFDILDNYLASLSDEILSIELDGLEPRAQLAKVVREFLLFYEGMDHEHKIQTEGLPLLSEEQQRILKNYQRDMVNLMSDILVANSPQNLAVDSGLVKDAAMSVFGMLNWFYMWNPRADRAARISYAETVTDLTLGGIGALGRGKH